MQKYIIRSCNKIKNYSLYIFLSIITIMTIYLTSSRTHTRGHQIKIKIINVSINLQFYRSKIKNKKIRKKYYSNEK